MNARSQVFELSVEGRQIEEVVASIFHALLFHRTVGKLSLREGQYVRGSVGFLDEDCDFVDFTYVRVSSDELDASLKNNISAFMEAMRNGENTSGQISLEFYQKKKARWPFAAECTPWEVWTVKIDVIELANESERQVCREKVGELLADKIRHVNAVMNHHEYTPSSPDFPELSLVFDTSFSDVQPYLHKISFSTNSPSNPSVGNAMRKLIKDTLAL